jgi:Fanconi anemia group M protein
VVFFEPIPSEIRSIQRRGRAGRLQAGRVFVLITEDTRDEAYFRSSQKKEESMKRIVSRMQLGFAGKKPAPKKEQAAGKKEGAIEKNGKGTARRKGQPTQSRITDY